MKHKERMAAEVQKMVGGITKGYADKSGQSYIKAEQDVREALLAAVYRIDHNVALKKKWRLFK